MAVTISPQTARRLQTLAAKHRISADKTEAARLELRDALLEARSTAKLRELADVTGLSFQRIQQIVGPKGTP